VAAAQEGVVAQPQSFDMAADDADDITRLIESRRLRQVEMERDALASRIEMHQRHQEEMQEEYRRAAQQYRASGCGADQCLHQCGQEAFCR
jgi:hypothetical protein